MNTAVTRTMARVLVSLLPLPLLVSGIIASRGIFRTYDWDWVILIISAAAVLLNPYIRGISSRGLRITVFCVAFLAWLPILILAAFATVGVVFGDYL